MLVIKFKVKLNFKIRCRPDVIRVTVLVCLFIVLFMEANKRHKYLNINRQ